jgi:hypothetical protein
MEKSYSYQNRYNKLIKVSIFINCFLTLAVLTFPPSTPSAAFRFVSWADTKSGTATLKAESTAVAKLSPAPAFTIYPGDVCDSGPDATCFNTWQTAMNGGSIPGNSLFKKSFLTRGNHDSSGTVFWEANIKASVTATNIGSTIENFTIWKDATGTTMDNGKTYSFDYQNSHFIGVDLSAGDITGISGTIGNRSTKIGWIDYDLTQAEARGKTNAFLFWHGPLWSVDGHCCSTNSSLVTMLNNHPIVAAVFVGHEHVNAWVHMDSTKYSVITHPFEQFVTGDAGAGPNTCSSGRSNWCYDSGHAFAVIDVNDNNQFKITYLGSPNGYIEPAIYSQTFTNSDNTPSTTNTPTKPLTATVTKAPTLTLTKTPTATITSTTGKPGDANSDGVVNGIDYSIWNTNYSKNLSGRINGDFDSNGKVDGIDYVIWLTNYSTSITTTPNITSTPTNGFNFISWSDTETNLSTLASLSTLAKTLNPEFTIYNGDAEGGSGLSGWQTALDGNNSNGMSTKTFVVRGNGNSESNWYSFFNFRQVADNIGASYFRDITDTAEGVPNITTASNKTYAFDYGNSRFIGMDVPGCTSSLYTSTLINWVHTRIDEATAKNLNHVFLFFHGPIWYADNHTECVIPTSLVQIINDHPIVTAQFAGHEHLKAALFFGPNDARLSMSHKFAELFTAGAGGGTYSCNTARLNSATDYCNKFEGFANVTVNGNNVTVEYYGTSGKVSSTILPTINITK